MQLISCGSEGDTEKLQKLPFYECVRNCHKSLWSSNRRSIVAFSRCLDVKKIKLDTRSCKNRQSMLPTCQSNACHLTGINQ